MCGLVGNFPLIFQVMWNEAVFEIPQALLDPNEC